ncbi:hypothetical protein CENSYa_0898 [Cenarchaeum symbiosum A]|uniref:Uncharacterized protein n=1 Tax=Cenarchaeum symbiosum (strain A) TaxID=414004 RepID=A0RW13_CENSY|nr:hypothetical protein CENSYa_0898 [Cenarchaeum symbiosum A]
MDFIQGVHGLCMVRLRYWKLSPDEVAGLSYPEEMLLNWDIKCTREPEIEGRFIGVFMYKNGAPIDYTPTKGIAYFYNNISREELPTITGFLKKRFGGEELEKGERIFLKNSRETYSPADIAGLARELEVEFSTKAVITLEFQGLEEEKAKESGLPEAKLLPIPGK